MNYAFLTFTLILLTAKSFNISRCLVGNKLTDHSDVIEASPVGDAPTASSFLT